MTVPKIGGTQVYQPNLTGGGQKARSYIKEHKENRKPCKRILNADDLILPDPEEMNELLREKEINAGTYFRIFLKYIVFFLASSYVYFIALGVFGVLISTILFILSYIGINIKAALAWIGQDLINFVILFLIIGGPFLITGVRFYLNRKKLGSSHGCD